MAKTARRMELNRTASFRPPNARFVTMFNTAMNATQLSINELCVAAIEIGLPQVVPKLLDKRRTEEKERLKAEEQFQQLLGGADPTNPTATAVLRAATARTEAERRANGRKKTGETPSK